MADNTLSFIADGKRYDITVDDLTAADAGDFRRAVGMPLSSVFANAGMVDVDVLAGLVWLARRRQQKGLSYHSVAETLTYGNVQPVLEDAPAEEDPLDPS